MSPIFRRGQGVAEETHNVAAGVDPLVDLRASGLASVQEIQFQYKRDGGGGSWTTWLEVVLDPIFGWEEGVRIIGVGFGIYSRRLGVGVRCERKGAGAMEAAAPLTRQREWGGASAGAEKS